MDEVIFINQLALWDIFARVACIGQFILISTILLRTRPLTRQVCLLVLCAFVSVHSFYRQHPVHGNILVGSGMSKGVKSIVS
jgi:hypothetical protein